MRNVLLKIIAFLNIWSRKNKQVATKDTSTCGYMHDDGIGA